MSSVIFSGNDVKTLKSNIDLNGQAKILSGTVDPTSSAVNAPIGSIYLNSSNGFIYKKQDSGSSTNWVKVSTGGDAGINYISNPSADQNTTGAATYADGAATPTDGTGGSPTATITRTTSSPIRGLANYLFTPGTLGDGVSWAFTIDAADQAKKLLISFDYALSGTITEGDYVVYIYDVTNSTLIQAAPYKLSGTSGTNYSFKATFQSASNSTSYRVILHQAVSTSVTVKFCRLSVSPQAVTYTSPQTDWTSFTPTGSWNTNTTYTGRWRRVGDEAIIHYLVQCTNTPNSASLTLNPPSGLTMDTSKLTSTGMLVSVNGRISTTSDNWWGIVASCSSTVINVSYLIGVTTTDIAGNIRSVTQAVPVAPSGSNNYTLELTVRVPIAGWSTSAAVSSSDSSEGRVVAARATNATATVTGSYSDVTWTTVDRDSHYGFGGTGSVSSYTIPVTGFYDFSGTVDFGTSAVTANNKAQISLYNSTTSTTVQEHIHLYQGTSTNSFTVPFNFRSIYLTAGTVMKIRVSNSGTGPVINNNATGNILSISRVSGNSSIYSGESVIVQANTTTAQSLSGGYTHNTIIYTAKDIDTHGAYSTSTGTFTAPIAGVYEISASYAYASRTWATTDDFYMTYKKNGSAICQENFTKPAAITEGGNYAGRTHLVRLNAGDTLTIAEFHGPATSYSLTATQSNVISTLSIKRVGN